MFAFCIYEFTSFYMIIRASTAVSQKKDDDKVNTLFGAAGRI